MLQLVECGLDPATPGFAVDVGANDGLLLSQTVDLEDLGWDVLCIEGNPLCWSELFRNRKLCMPYACSSAASELSDFTAIRSVATNVGEHYLAGSGLRPDYDQFDRIGEKGLRKAWKEVFKVPVRTLDWCVEQAGFPRVDALVVDTEGHDLEVLKGFSIKRWQPKMVCVENWNDSQDFKEWFESRGYRRIRRYDYNDVYAPA